MPLSRVIAVGNGVTRNFTVNFALGYLNTASVSCRVGTEVDGAGNPAYRSLTWNSPNIATVAGAIPASGVPVVFDRTIRKDGLIVNYEDGAVINQENLNTSQKQALMLVHEVLDGRITQIANNLAMGGFRLTNLGEPVNSTDGATKAYVDARYDTGAANAAAAAASAVNSANSATASAGSAAAASASQGAAYQSEQQAAARAAETLANRNATAADRTQTGQDKAATAADRTAIAGAQSATAADRVATGQDRTATNTAKNEAVTAKDTAVSAAATSSSNRDATGADRTQTGQDRTATAADRVATGQDVTTTGQYREKARQWATAPEDQVVEDGFYSAYHWAQKAMDYAGGEISMDSVQGLNDALAARLRKAGDSMTGALTVSAGEDGRAPIRFQNISGTLTVADGDFWMQGTGLWVRYGGSNKTVRDTGNLPDMSSAETSSPWLTTAVRAMTPAQVNTIATDRVTPRMLKAGDTMTGALNIQYATPTVSLIGARQWGISVGATGELNFTDNTSGGRRAWFGTGGNFNVTGTVAAADILTSGNIKANYSGARVTAQTSATGTNAHFELQGPGGGEWGLLWSGGANLQLRAMGGTPVQISSGGDLFASGQWMSVRDATIASKATLSGQEYIQIGSGRFLGYAGDYTRLKFHTSSAVNQNLYYKIDDEPSWRQITSNSDARLKKNIRVAPTGALELVKQLLPKTFSYKQNLALYQDAGERYGFIAQDLQQVLPNTIVDSGIPGQEEVLLGLANDACYQLIAVLTKALQELSAEVDALKKGTTS